MKRRIPIIILLLALVGVGAYFLTRQKPGEIILTGIVTTDEVSVSSEIQGRIQQLSVNQGDTVTNGQLLAVIQPQEQEANVAYFISSEHQTTAQLEESKADLENARLTFEREQDLYKRGVDSVQVFDQARTAYDAAKARVAALERQTQAATAQKEKAAVQLGYTEIHAPITGFVNTRVALQGEVVNPAEAIVTLINPDDLWVRADVEETYIEHVRLGDTLTVRFPSGAEREGKVFYIGADADYATQRDVSRTKRDIKTFEIRLRCNNSDRRLAVGMTAYVIFPTTK
ncbi:MAG TPA: efflux RND transporter periplasmic adaptor subunit [Verrucomicrobiae bacterium]|nr:efflux RND transporter periplasmic adaptor subunit [Verrucomicrobiae bacterium]